ncbi:putative short-chain dehydrogenase/reductase [Xylaria bambusicola]|uniref:putative short-chain dehydrogenase/reductase n=1 Tax=Xylaria bambusicola TaxID=326684 RepID=UPI002008E1F7|nr:putative short-chain dehydrogenase/reductase [Xylaria bambusicola]KAI0506261.1 putative short-chain dehydrogenase/reductase [Xylaria bambusicola]
MPIAKKTVLITGCSEGGIGAAMAMAFSRQGFHVFATLRNTSRIGALAEIEDLEVLELEVTSTESVARCVEHVRERTGGTLDVLVNNAGRGFLMPLLDVNIDAAKELFDINVWGALIVTQGFAPLIINAKGAIVNHSSVAGNMLIPWKGIYTMSKAAVTQFSETLRVELEPLGVRVVTALIGAVHTRALENSRSEEFKMPSDSYFNPARQSILDEYTRIGYDRSEQVDVTARRLVNDIVYGATGRVWRGGSAKEAKWLTWLLPRWAMQKLTSKAMGLEDLTHYYTTSEK